MTKINTKYLRVHIKYGQSILLQQYPTILLNQINSHFIIHCEKQVDYRTEGNYVLCKFMVRPTMYQIILHIMNNFYQYPRETDVNRLLKVTLTTGHPNFILLNNVF